MFISFWDVLNILMTQNYRIQFEKTQKTTQKRLNATFYL